MNKPGYCKQCGVKVYNLSTSGEISSGLGQHVSVVLNDGSTADFTVCSECAQHPDVAALWRSALFGWTGTEFAKTAANMMAFGALCVRKTQKGLNFHG